MKIVGIMPLKLNNERLPGKNLMLLGDKQLFRHSLDSLVSTGMCNDIYVFCSDESVGKYLPSNVNYLKRDIVLDLPSSNFNQIFDAFSQIVDADIYVYIHATAPYISEQSMKDCIDAVKTGKYDSAFCSTVIQDYLWSNGKPLNFDPSNLPRSQDLAPIYRETSSIYVFTKKMYQKLHRRIGVNPFIKVVGYRESVDINDKDDFLLAEALLKAEL